jgi:hypothetical protein
MENNNKDKVEIQVTAAQQNTSTFVEIYKATLNFLGQISIPLSLLVICLVYRTEISTAMAGMKVSKVKTPLGDISFANNIAEDLVSTAPDSVEHENVLQKIELKEESMRAAIDTGLQKETPVAAVEVTEPGLEKAQAEPGWQSVLGISWVKPTDIFGRTYYLDVDNTLFVWPLELDKQAKRAKFVINTSAQSRNKGSLVLEQQWLSEGKYVEFSYKKQTYRLNLLDIRKAGKFPSDAAYISVDVKKG